MFAADRWPELEIPKASLDHISRLDRLAGRRPREVVPLDEKTLYAPGKPTVLVRELGPRQLSDVPRSEVAKLIRYLGLERAADDVIKRAVLNAYGPHLAINFARGYMEAAQTP